MEDVRVVRAEAAAHIGGGGARPVRRDRRAVVGGYEEGGEDGEDEPREEGRLDDLDDVRSQRLWSVGRECE